MNASPASAEVQRVDTPLGRLSFRQAGAAVPTHVLLHGIGSASGSWQAQLDWAQDRSDVGLLAWDAPGYGSSSPVAPAQPQAEDYAQRLWSWLDGLGERDLISVPPGVYREEHNVGDEDALMCVMLGTPKPITPVYPPDSPLATLKR